MSWHIHRREWLRRAASGLTGLSVWHWFDHLAASVAAEPTRPRKSCILLWMDGGASHIDTFDPKPEAPLNVRGDLRAIETKVPGILLAEKFPTLAAQMQHAAIVRSLRTDVADHLRARVYVHTGYKPNPAGPHHPGLGSIVSAELGDPDAQLPNFVACGTPRTAGGLTFLDNAGYLGPRHTPLIVTDASKGLANLRARIAADEFARRFSVLDQLNAAFQSAHSVPAAAAHRAVSQKAVALMQSDKNQAFDLSREPGSTQDRYGANEFGRACLLARRLVEAGVPFVEVYSRDWDNHDGPATDRLKNATMPEFDRGLGTLIEDLSDRGLLEQTLVIAIGEFGRTPQINAHGGRDHFATAWSAVLAGGGIRCGQVVGKSTADGSAVAERPVSMVDLMATICTVLGIDFSKRYEARGRREFPIVDLLTQEHPNVLNELL